MLFDPYFIADVQQVHCSNCGGTPVLEWVGAIAGVVGGVAAVAAWVLAARSARDSSRSADAAKKGADAALRGAKAAEEELKLMRAEIEVAQRERERRASFLVRLSRSAVATVSGGGSDPRPVSAVMCFGVSDTGTRAA
ncbi:MAG: hypothetical protein JWQ76_5805 [Ramlibacter sp.]|nr:hypothetical protein [Ramlibacter sp.]